MAKDVSKLHSIFGNAVFQFLAAFTGSLNLLNSGLHFGWTSPSLPKILSNDSHLSITPNEGSLIASAIMFGIVIGSALTACLLDKLGRKAVILLANVPFFISWLLIAIAHSPAMFILGRLFAGIADGLSYSSVAIYIGEISQAKFRGLLGGGASVLWLFGTLLMNVLGSYFPIRTTALCSCFISVISVMTFSWMPESPYQLLMKNHDKKAAESLKILRGSKTAESDLPLLATYTTEQRLNSGKYLKLFTVHSNRKALFIVLAYRSLQVGTGTSAITFYAQIIFKQAGSDVFARLGSSIYFAIFLIFNVVCSVLLDKFGRRPLLMFSSAGCCLSLFIIGGYFYIAHKTNIDVSDYSLVPLIGLLLYSAMYSVGFQGTTAVLIGELFAMSVKPLAACICHMVFAGSSIIIIQSFQYLMANFGVHVPFFMFSAFSLIALIFVINVLPETKGKTLEEIQQDLVFKSNGSCS